MSSEDRYRDLAEDIGAHFDDAVGRMVKKTTFEQSASIGAIAKALANAQKVMEPAKFDSKNPHFNSMFASLASVVEAVKPLADNGIAFHQAPVNSDEEVGVRTCLMHESGEWMATTCYATPKDGGPQAFGSVVTYLRRYSLSAAAGIAADEDDDAETATRTPSAPKAATKPQTVDVPDNTAALAELSTALMKLGLKTQGAQLVWISGMVGKKVSAEKLPLATRETLAKLLNSALNGEMPADEKAGAA